MGTHQPSTGIDSRKKDVMEEVGVNEARRAILPMYRNDENFAFLYSLYKGSIAAVIHPAGAGHNCHAASIGVLLIVLERSYAVNKQSRRDRLYGLLILWASSRDERADFIDPVTHVAPP